MMKFLGQTITAQKTFSISLTKKAVIVITCLLLNLTITSAAKAEEIVITVDGNGSGSSNEAQVQSQATTEVSQNNSANVTNNVDSNTNTGNNDATQNTGGDTTISTGDAENTTNVNNENINTNVANVTDCCNGGTTVNVSGNGAGSTNVGVADSSTTHLVSQNNYASISNNITVNANTGYNNASFNGGSSAIITGNIKALTYVNNENINNSFYDGQISMMGDSSVIIKDNGTDSFNMVTLNDDTSILISNNNLANILNNVEHNLNTGGNTTLANIGDAAIITGNIISDITINNENINSNFVEVSCNNCNKPNGDGDGDGNGNGGGPTPPTTPGTSTVQGAGGSSSSGNGSSGPAGNILPATGNSIPYTLFATLILFFMFLSGLYLRFNSAHAPPLV